MHATFWSMKIDSLEGCVREKRVGEGGKAKDSVVRGRRREKDLGERRTEGATRERRRDGAEESILGVKGEGEGRGAVSKRPSVQVSESCISHN